MQNGEPDGKGPGWLIANGAQPGRLGIGLLDLRKKPSVTHVAQVPWPRGTIAAGRILSTCHLWLLAFP